MAENKNQSIYKFETKAIQCTEGLFAKFVEPPDSGAFGTARKYTIEWVTNLAAATQSGLDFARVKQAMQERRCRTVTAQITVTASVDINSMGKYSEGPALETT